MKNIRRLDGQGRIILPSHIRKELNLEKDSEVTIDLKEDGSVLLKPARLRCALCEAELGDGTHEGRIRATIKTCAGKKKICNDCLKLILEDWTD